MFDYLVECTLLPLPSARRIFGQLVLGVGYMHGEGVVHRDLKLENVLLDEKLDVRIADLGFGREWEKGRWMETWVGTLGYCAPEIIAAKRYLGEGAYNDRVQGAGTDAVMQRSTFGRWGSFCTLS